MNLLFDQGTPAPLRKALVEHRVETAFERGWSTLLNGQLIAAAEAAGFDALVTTDRNLKYQQNRSQRRIAVVVLLSTSWPRIQRHLPRVVAEIDTLVVGAYGEIAVD